MTEQAPDPSIRYLLFRTGDMYSISGAMEDCVGKYATVEEARGNAEVWCGSKKYTGNDVIPEAVIAKSIAGPWTEHEIYDTWTGEDVPVIVEAGSL